MASWYLNLFERSSFVASGKARQLHRAFGALYSALAVTSKKKRIPRDTLNKAVLA